MSVLAHIVLKGGLQSEPAATLALAHILKANPEIARAFVRLLRPAGVEFTPDRVEAEKKIENGRVDLKISDAQDRKQILVENKFWAGLTDDQPVGYLNTLPPGGALMFITPDPRVNAVWDALKTRCDKAGLQRQDGDATSTFTWSCVNEKIMCITSWKVVLEALLLAAHPDKHEAARHDILQLRGLTEREDSEAFLPIRTEELTDQAAVRRIINYIDLINEIRNILKSKKIADQDGLRAGKKGYSFGHFMNLWAGGVKFREVQLRVDFKVWGRTGITPLWWRLHRDNFENRLDAIRDQFPGSLFYPNEIELFIPIHLRTGVEKEQVIEGVLEQTHEMIRTLRDQFPDEG